MAAPAYFDTSVLVKQYVDEPGAAAARQQFRRHRIVSSVIAPIEILSALSRRQAMAQLTAPSFSRIVNDLRVDRAHWELLGVNESVLSRAEALLPATRLRALDALHVASAQLAATMAGTPFPFITADTRQRAAAEQLGLDVIWVG